MELEIKAYGKINLALEVVNKREDGYHNIDTIMQEIDLHDVISIETGRKSFALTSDDSRLELNEDNLVYKAWDQMRRIYDGNPSVNIHIEKNIPLAAGLAGGSTDCAATIKGLNEFWGLGLSNEEMANIGLKLGADVPFFFYGGMQRARGIGERLDEIKTNRNYQVILLSNNLSISTKYVYENIKNINNEIDVAMIKKLIEDDNELAFKYLENKLEEVSFLIYPELEQMKRDLINEGALVSLMSGSGPTIFGLFEDEESADKAVSRLSKKYFNIIRTETRNNG